MDEDIQILYSKVQKLENRITSLRIGRRILMDLLIEQENVKEQEIQKLTQEINRLKYSLKYSR
ncbi:MAG TPA: hypothetical protein GX519_07180 [Thermoanaerobacterales bacterium]|nr:hypothetical protein [Thermoanaerobacterales bacterium]